MNSIHKRRLFFLSFLILGLGVATSLILYAFSKNINVFLTPSQVVATAVQADYHFRLGGMVKKGSVVHESSGIGLSFTVTDMEHELLVKYTGIVPDLFREGKGVIADGYLDGKGIFIATQVLAKHDENYKPKRTGSIA